MIINGSYSNWLPVTSGVPQGSVLGPLLFILYIDDLQNVVSHSTLKLFADDVALYREIKHPADCLLLQQDLDNIYSWTIKWQLCLNASNCLAFFISNKRKLINFMYSVNSITISWNSIVKYLEVHIQSTLSWSHHCKVVSTKARRSLNHLRHSLWGATTAAKSVAYKCLVRPLLEYACQVWSSHTACDISGLESVQHRAARWACGILFPGNGVSHLMIVLIHCAGLVSLIVITICLCQHCMISSTTEHLLTFMITIAVILPAPEPMNCLLYLYYLLSTVTVILFCEYCIFVVHCII